MEANVQLRDEDCEKIVLGTIITERDAFDDIGTKLTEECFYNPFHREIFKAVKDVVSSGIRPDMITVKAKLDANGVTYNLVDYMKIASCFTPDRFQHVARLFDLSVRRKFWEIGQYLVSNSQHEAEDIADVTNRAAENLTNLFKASDSNICSIDESLESVHKMINSNQVDVKPMTGTPTGFSKIDDRCGGLQKSDLIIIAADTSQGKTSFAVSVMKNAALYGAKISMYSMEMKKEQITARIVSMESGVPANEIMYSRLTQSQIHAVDKGIGKVYGKGIYFDDRSTSNIDSIISSIRYMKMKFDIDGAIVDYLQILNVNMKGTNKEQQMGDVARRLKNLAKDLDIWIIALSQLSRDSLNPAPSLSRLRDSGQIGEAADTVILIYRPEVYGKSYPDEFSSVSTRGTALIEIAKGRNVGLMKFICGFDAPTTRFYDMDSVPVSNEYIEENPF